jgi:hypothetical protein
MHGKQESETRLAKKKRRRSEIERIKGRAIVENSGGVGVTMIATKSALKKKAKERRGVEAIR